MFANEIKLARAIKDLKDRGITEPTHDQIKEVYVKFGGFYVDLAVEEEVVKDEVNEEEAPKRGRKASK